MRGIDADLAVDQLLKILRTIYHHGWYAEREELLFVLEDIGVDSETIKRYINSKGR